MDEYLFIAWAKLKTEQLKPACEQRATAELPVEAPHHSAKRAAQQPLKAGGLSRAPLWREQS